MKDLERMARMWNVEGLSMGAIAQRMGMTRNMVSGLIYRHRDKFNRRNKNASIWRDVKRGRVKPTEQKPQQPIVTASQKANQRRKAFHAVKTAEEAASAPVEIVEPEIDGKEYDAGRLPMAKELLDLGACDCRWPLNDGGPFIFCAAEVVTGSAYCQHHKARSTGKGTISEQRAIKDARWAA